MILALILALTTVTPPDLPTVPGADNPLVTQATIDQTICSKAKDAHGHTWVHDQRPPVSYTNKIKVQLFAASHYPGTIRDYELDHDKSIEAGGSPTSLQNLWLEHYSGPLGARVKDQAEDAVHRAICRHTITLDEGRQALSGNWIDAYRLFVGPLPSDPTPTGERG